MDNHSKIKYDLLGEPIGTASNKLRKMVLFQLIRKAGLDNCFQCGEVIDNIDNFSIEHKVPWQSANDPIKSFYDLDNIAFSHLHCNISNARKEKAGHGHIRTYINGCRCLECRAVNAERVRRQSHFGD